MEQSGAVRVRLSGALNSCTPSASAPSRLLPPVDRDDAPAPTAQQLGAGALASRRASDPPQNRKAASAAWRRRVSVKVVLGGDVKSDMAIPISEQRQPLTSKMDADAWAQAALANLGAWAPALFPSVAILLVEQSRSEPSSLFWRRRPGVIADAGEIAVCSVARDKLRGR
jgi:hypothetical protein